jgi:glycosyltransferase involved in cell wall biosynthesis
MGNLRKVLLVFSECDNSPQLFAIYQKLSREADDIKIILILPPKTQLEKDLIGIHVPFTRWTPMAKWKMITQSIFLATRLFRNRPTLVLASGQSATYISISAAFFARIKHRIFIRHHADFHHSHKMKVGVLADLFVNFLATRIVAVSKLVQTILVSKEYVKESKVRTISNGFKVQDFLDARKENHQEDLEIVIGTVGRFTHLKGLVHVAEAFATLSSKNPNLRLVMLGAPSTESAAVELALREVDKSKYKILQSFKGMPEFYRKIDIAVHIPIGPFEEAFGLVYLEALAAGCVCVFTRSGVLLNDRTFDQYFEFVDYGSTSSLLNVLNSLTKNFKDQFLQNVPEQLFERFSLENMAEEYLGMLKSE